MLDCPYLKFCQSVFTDVKCKTLEDCILVKKLGDPSIKKKLNKFLKTCPSTKEFLCKEVTCPRSLYAQVKLTKPCTLTTCSYFSDKLTYNCNMIHQNVFFRNMSKVPQKLHEVSLGYTQTQYERLLNIAIYLLRAYILIANYCIVTGKISGTSVLSQYDYCHFCGALVTNSCDCLTTKDVRIARVKFHNKWSSLFKESEEVSYDSLKIYNLAFIREELFKITVMNTKLSDIPFGFILTAYTKLFSSEKISMADNLGIREARLENALKLWGKDG